MRFLDLTSTYHNRRISAGRVIGPSQSSLPDNTKNTRDRHPCLFRTRSPRKQVAVNTRRRRRGHLDQQHKIIQLTLLTLFIDLILFFVTNLRINNEPIVNTSVSYEVLCWIKNLSNNKNQNVGTAFFQCLLCRWNQRANTSIPGSAQLYFSI
jgi:hypothetical protein